MNDFFDAGKLADDVHTLVNDAEALLRATADGGGEKAACQQNLAGVTLVSSVAVAMPPNAENT